MAYLTTADYIERYGEQETIRLTDETRSGQYDSAKVQTAIDDATEEVDSYLGKRYKIPIIDPPRLVRGMVAILARDYLSTTRPAADVTREADRVRAQLKDISRGLMTLPGVDGVIAEDGRPAADSATSNDALSPIFTEANLAGFSLPSGYPVACWKR